MIELNGKSFRCCDGVNRRNALKAGFLGLGGLTLADMLRLRAEAAADGGSLPKTSVIFVELAGGPTHIETYDPKPHAPAEYRGPLSVANTNVPGIQLSELMKRQAQVMDKLAVVRSLRHDSSSHGTSAHLTQTGFYLQDRQSRTNSMPCAGSVTAKLRGANATGVPAYVAIPRTMRYGNAAYLGKGYNPFQTGGDPNRSNFQVQNLSLNRSLDMERVTERRALLTAFDESRRVIDTEGSATAIDDFTQQAFELVTSDKARQAFDISKESDKVRDRYGRHTTGQSLLLARRLVEAGVTFASVRIGGWDMHGKIERAMKKTGVAMDQGLGALVGDLYDRGLDRDVLVVVIGEFGRTPRINKNAGRDHWGSSMSAMLSGGGLKVGQVVGTSSPKGETPRDNPYRPENILAMVYRHLGIDSGMTFTDLSGRPRYVLERRELISELI